MKKGFLNLTSYKLGVLLCLGVLWHRLHEAVSFFYLLKIMVLC